MTMILASDGGGLAKKSILVLSARQMAWFLDPEALLAHLGDLHVVKVAAICQHCYERGVPEDVTATFNPSTRQWTVRCACADYPPIVDRGDAPIEIHQPQADGTITRHVIRSVDELLAKLGWSFKCAGDCARLGMHDGVQGMNDTAAQVLKVSCGCTERLYQEPAAGRC
jgi:hypothetical protein